MTVQTSAQNAAIADKDDLIRLLQATSMATPIPSSNAGSSAQAPQPTAPVIQQPGAGWQDDFKDIPTLRLDMDPEQLQLFKNDKNARLAFAALEAIRPTNEHDD
ncbi:unnamed protein product [Polarella glacialis]|uniref:Uncharacterized protein n=1 Tax=Polarella glacialis TaxID=89957 RepID=A0A813ENX1_POLGL|nr:unnamed protein product [Polarella glacialis]